MSWLGFEMPLITTSSFLCLFLVILLALIKNFQKQWWTPNRIQNRMAAQGVHGPSYKFIHGNTKEILSMKRETMSKPRSLTHDIFSAVQPHIHAWSKIFGKNFLQWYGVQPQMIIAEPELCKEKLLGDSISMAEGEKWVKLRKLAHLAFHGESLKSMIPEMIKSSETMVQRWKTYEGKEIEVNEEFRFFTSEVISRTAFGSSFLEGRDIFEMLRELTSLIFRNTFKLRLPGISMFYKTSDEIKSEKLEKGIHDIITEIVRKREKTAMTGEADGFGSDYLGILLKAHHDANEKQRISVDDLVDECKTFYFAGRETTNSLLAWTVFLLALHTDWQEDARKKVLELFGNDETPGSDGLNKLKTEVRLGQVVVPANVELHVTNLALHHEPKYWGKDVQLFKPERFSEGVAKATNNNAVAFMPFGMGPRTCVGMNFAVIGAKIALSMILQRYSFTLSPGYVHSPIQFLTVRPQHGVQVILHPV
ncbi:cytochrome P450 CYP749A22-like [Pyrus ussuriensis x Pyrus communis]|uniref:Cytochrome P450 CYP749A22-like n=1 Tax=Pyrus ussuriensis x Pyrus communis TaxID=2448454 RepID=A0A5N5FHF6_9ROSA|nr:cytochrome P450 CYP749A22-like [Pyrus ussuriensis x Pyrus communis]